ALVLAEAEQMAANARQDIETHGIQKNITVQSEWFVEPAQRRVKLGLIMAELVKANDLRAKPEQVRALVEEQAQSYESPEELVRWYYLKPERLAQVEAVAVEDNVVEWICSKANTSDKPITFDELMGNNPAAAGNAAVAV
ncbi:MAG: trigger factor, partial [Azoarcus sp.]|nr:trigger factor [Azoarcus sp.]